MLFFVYKKTAFPLSGIFSAAARQTDIISTIYPSSKTRRDIMLEHPNIEIVPLQMRLIKYQINDNTFCLGTTLVDQSQYNNTQEFIDLYHARWGVEELYKVSKRIFIIEDFHAKSERGVKQKIFAHFALITRKKNRLRQPPKKLCHLNSLSEWL